MGLLLLTHHKEYKEPIFILTRQNSIAQRMTLVCTQNIKWLRYYILTQEHTQALHTQTAGGRYLTYPYFVVQKRHKSLPNSDGLRLHAAIPEVKAKVMRRYPGIPAPTHDSLLWLHHFRHRKLESTCLWLTNKKYINTDDMSSSTILLQNKHKYTYWNSFMCMRALQQILTDLHEIWNGPLFWRLKFLQRAPRLMEKACKYDYY